MWIFTDRLKILTIQKINSSYILSISGTYVGSFNTPEEAASRVASCVTGVPEWDSTCVQERPLSLHDWKESRDALH